MNLYEGIKNNLKEAYEVGLDDKKLFDAGENFSNMLENVTDKYITKDVVQGVYKLINSGQDTDFLTQFYLNGDDALGKALDVFNLSNGETLYLYGPIEINTNYSDVEVNVNTVVSIGIHWDDMISRPGSDLDDSWVWFCTADGALELSNNYNGNRKYLENILAMLEKKYDILQVYKQYCKKLADIILSKTNQMSETRKKDIADKQRKVASIVNDSEGVKNDDKIWELIDDYESGRITKDEVIEKVTELNNGDKDEIKADLDLIFKESEKLNEEAQSSSVYSDNVTSKCKLIKNMLSHYGNVSHVTPQLSFNDEDEAIDFSVTVAPDKFARQENSVEIYGTLYLDKDGNFSMVDVKTSSGPNILNRNFITALNALYTFVEHNGDSYDG